MASSSRFLQRVVHREIKTFFSVSEILECGHHVESTFLLEPLIAKRRVCQQCAKVSALPPKKPVQPSPNYLRNPESYEPPWKKIG